MSSEVTEVCRSCSSISSNERSELTTEVFDSFEALAAMQEEWDAFVAQSGADIYFVTDWLQTWWEHYGGQRELRCFLVRTGDTIVAAFPFCIDSFCIGPFAIRLARMVGSDSTISVLYPAVEQGYEKAAVDVICRSLLVDDRCDAVSMSPLSGLSPVGDAIQELCNGIDAYVLARDDSTGPHTVFALPNTFQEYIKKLPSKSRGNFRRHERRLSARYSLVHEVVTGEELISCYDAFVALHNEQWRAVGRMGHFGDWPGSHSFNRDLVVRLGRKQQVRFHVLRGDGEVLSMQYGFVFADRCYARLPARRTDSTSDNLGIGQVGFVKLLEALIGEGVRSVESGPGQYDYKLEYGGQQHLLRRQVISRGTLSSRIKTRMLLQWSDALHFVYYRLWFLKLAHALRVPARPLSQLWIRSRV